MRRGSERRAIAAGADVMTCPLSPAERGFVEALKRAIDETPDANLVRIALWSLCAYLGIHLEAGVFELDPPRAEDAAATAPGRSRKQRQAAKA